MADSMAKPHGKIGRAHHRHPGRHQTLQPRIGVRPPRKRQGAKQGFGGPQHRRIDRRLAAPAIQPLNAMVKRLDAGGHPQPFRGCRGHFGIQNYQVGIKPRMAYPDLVTRRIVQHIPAAHIELPRRQRSGDAYLQRQRLALQVGAQHHILAPSPFPQFANGIDALRHQNRNHPGGVGYGAAAHPHQRIRAQRYRPVGRLHRRRQRRPLRQPGVHPHAPIAQSILRPAHHVRLLRRGPPRQRQRPPPAQFRHFPPQSGRLALPEYHPRGHRGIKFPVQPGVCGHCPYPP